MKAATRFCSRPSVMLAVLAAMLAPVALAQTSPPAAPATAQVPATPPQPEQQPSPQQEQPPSPTTTPSPRPPVPVTARSLSKPLGRPKICLVLSGGGARGAAHIGVLRVLEEMHVPVDCIAGTSMGSLVGGAYASGMSVPDMERLVAGLSTQKIFKERPPRQDLAIRRKLDDYTDLVTPEIGISKNGALLPKGAVSGVQLETVLRQLAQVPGYRNFDELPIPYRAVATDLVTGTAVVFSSGELANVMRASMSVPGAVAPEEYEGKLLVDGGLTDNLPVDVARAMGADVIIAVNLGTSLMRRDQLHSVIDVTSQMLNVLTEQNVRNSLAQLKPTDILILPELGDFSAADFDNLPKTIPIGEAAARKVADRLAALSLPPAQYAALRENQHKLPPPDLRPVDEIRFNAMQRVNPEYAKDLMETGPNQPIDQAQLDQDMRRLFGTGDFEHVNYRFLEEPGRRVLSVNAVEKSWGPDYLRFGMGLTSDFRGDAFFNLLASYRRTWLNSLGAEWRNDLQVGQTNRIISEFYQPLDTQQRFFVAPRVEAERRPVDVFQGNSRIATLDLRQYYVALDFGTTSKYGEMRLGVETGGLKGSVSTGDSSLLPDTSHIGRGAITFRGVYDQLDSINFPRRGLGAQLRLYASQPGLGAEQAYVKGEVNGTYALSSGRHTVNLSVRAGSKIGGDSIPTYDLFQWGGFLQQSGYATGQLLGGNLQFARLVYYNRLVQQKLLEGVYAGFSLELGHMGDAPVAGAPTGLLKSAAAFLAVDSPIGPLYLGYGRAVGGSYGVYLFLGKP